VERLLLEELRQRHAEGRVGLTTGSRYPTRLVGQDVATHQVRTVLKRLEARGEVENVSHRANKAQWVWVSPEERAAREARRAHHLLTQALRLDVLEALRARGIKATDRYGRVCLLDETLQVLLDLLGLLNR
jgi:DNA-binding MarR family transcriptional regulator